jgi:hypothetical protein
MGHHERAQTTTHEKALWLATLDALEQEFLAFQQASGTAHRATASRSGTLALIDTDVQRTQQLLLNLG